jgi:hypothetical protein
MMPVIKTNLTFFNALSEATSVSFLLWSMNYCLSIYFLSVLCASSVLSVVYYSSHNKTIIMKTIISIIIASFFLSATATFAQSPATWVYLFPLYHTISRCSTGSVWTM